MEILCIVLMIPFYLAICKCVDDATLIGNTQGYITMRD